MRTVEARTGLTSSTFAGRALCIGHPLGGDALCAGVGRALCIGQPLGGLEAAIDSWTARADEDAAERESRPMKGATSGRLFSPPTAWSKCELSHGPLEPLFASGRTADARHTFGRGRAGIARRGALAAAATVDRLDGLLALGLGRRRVVPPGQLLARGDVAGGKEEHPRRVGEAGRFARVLGTERCGADRRLTTRVHEARRVAVEGGVDDEDLGEERVGARQLLLGVMPLTRTRLCGLGVG